jgi:hypothetical protein
MAKSIAVRLGTESSRFGFAKLERERLYGRKERQVVDAEGRRCTGAWLSADGAALVPSGGLAMLYVDPGFGTVERSTLKAVDEHGAPLPLQPSTLGVEQELAGPLPAARLLEHAVHSVYTLMPEAVGPTLTAALGEGKIFSAPFNYRDDYRLETMFLLGNEAGLFALVGTATHFDMVVREAAPPSPPSEGDELSDDLDFSMM